MTSMRPYLLRAIYTWIIDNHCTPYLLVDAISKDVVVPRSYVDNGKIVLNISPRAVQQLSLESESVSFSARFSGTNFGVFVPLDSVLAIYAKENGKGMFFQPEEGSDVETAVQSLSVVEESPTDDEPPKPPTPSRPVLKRVK